MKKDSNRLVCYLTGAPASGKSTLCEMLVREYPEVKIFSYSKVLCEYINAKGTVQTLDEDLIRKKSSTVISSEDVDEVDRRLINFVNKYRGTYTIIIDSHPVTKEKYGFRITAFGINELIKLNPDKIFCLYAQASLIGERIKRDSQGRPLPSLFDLDVHCNAQISVATQYGVLLGKTCYLLDSSKEPEDILSDFVILSGIVTVD